jgi:hypothetical protein
MHLYTHSPLSLSSVTMDQSWHVSAKIRTAGCPPPGSEPPQAAKLRTRSASSPGPSQRGPRDGGV